MRRRVFELIRSGACLGSEPDPSDQRFRVVLDQSTASAYAFEQAEGHPEYEGFAEEPTVWTDLREQAFSQLSCPNLFFPLSEEIDSWLFAYLPLEAQSIRTEVACDLAFCVAVTEAGHTHPLADQLIEAYEAGVWPCGWSGRYPEGKLCVSSAPREELTGSAAENRKLHQQRKARQVLEDESRGSR